MERKNYEDIASGLFLKGCNCAQAVFLAFREEIGLDEDSMIRLSAPFGGGCAGMREMCGAVSGMVMVMGCLTASSDYGDPAAKKALYKRVQCLVDQFEAENGSKVCAELLQLVKGARPDPSLRSEAYYKARPCVRLVHSAARILGDWFEGQKA